jgi:hypothetical protein
VAGYINPVTGQVHNAGRPGTQTLIGAVCFLIGAVLLPERAEDVAGQVTAPTGYSTLASLAAGLAAPRTCHTESLPGWRSCCQRR